MTRYRDLHFDRIDMDHADVSSRCTRCGEEFTAKPTPGERADNVLLRIRDEFEAHECRA
jgi:hypothetical protein